MKVLYELLKKEFKEIAEHIPLRYIMEQKNNFVEPIIANAMVPAISDRVEEIDGVFSMDDNEVRHAESAQKRYDEHVQKALHGKKKKSRSKPEIEIETKRSIFKIPDRFTKESVLLKKAILSCEKKDVFRTELMKTYIEIDWQKFA